MSDYLRVKDNETGHEYSVTAERYDATPDLFTKVDKPATDSTGEPLPTKYKTSVTSRATENKAAKSVDQKEN